MTGERVHYREMQTLKQDDLGDEQAYRIHARRRHNLAQHSWGIVQGLALTITQGRVSLNPGFAVDGYGRELVVSDFIDFKDDLFARLLQTPTLQTLSGVQTLSLSVKAMSGATQAIDVWLHYRAHIQQPDAQQVAQEMFKGTGRVCEEAWLKLLCVDARAPVDPYRPPGVSESDLHFTPEQYKDLDGEGEWPVYLGRIALLSYQGRYVLNLPVVERVYAGLRGAGVSAPWGGSYMQIGASLFSDKNRFSVALADENGKAVRRLSLDSDANAVFKGTVLLKGASGDNADAPGRLALIPQAGGAAASPGLGFDTLTSAPDAARPWRIYRRDVQEGSARTQRLHFEIFDPGDEGDRAQSQWVIGGQKVETNEGQSVVRAFAPFLSVRADGTVVLSAQPEVQGRVIEGPVPLDFNDPRFRDELLTRWSKGLTTAGREVDAFYAVALTIDIVFKDGTATVSKDALEVGKAYTIALTVRNVSRELVARLLRIEFMVDYFASGDKIRTLILPPQASEVVAGEVLDIEYAGYSFISTGKAQATVTITASGLAQNTTEALQSIDITLS